MVNPSATVITVIAVAFTLLIGAMVYGSMQTQLSTSDVWENDSITNESKNFASNNTMYSVGNGPLARITGFYEFPNQSSSFAWSEVSDCGGNAGYAVNIENSSIKICTNGTGGWPNMTTGTKYYSYVFYGGTGYEAFEKISTQTYSGFKLGSLIPFILFAIAIIAIILGAFAIRS